MSTNENQDMSNQVIVDETNVKLPLRGKTRIDLETEIMACWSLVNDVEELYYAVGDTNIDRDQICNILLGLTELYNLKFSKMFETFEECIRNAQIK